METITLTTGQYDVPTNFTGIAIWTNGDKRWYLNARLHRIGGPSIERNDGTRAWFIEGQWYSEYDYWKQPENIEYNHQNQDNHTAEHEQILYPGDCIPPGFTGTKIWASGIRWRYKNGVVDSNQTFGDSDTDRVSNKIIDQTSMTIKEAKSKSNTMELKPGQGVPFNFTGIAIRYNGDKRWYLNGKFHRINGPAIECYGGDRFWYMNGEQHRIDGPAIECMNGYKGWFICNKQMAEDQYWKQAEVKKESREEMVFEGLEELVDKAVEVEQKMEW